MATNIKIKTHVVLELPTERPLEKGAVYKVKQADGELLTYTVDSSGEPVLERGITNDQKGRLEQLQQPDIDKLKTGVYTKSEVDTKISEVDALALSEMYPLADGITVLPTPPTFNGQTMSKAWAFIKQGVTYTQTGGSPITGVDGHDNRVIWNGTTWSLKDMGALLNNFNNYDFYWGIVGYVNKRFGNIDSSSTGSLYRSTSFQRISDRNNLKVTGFSGATSNVALIGFYDDSLNYIGYYNVNGVNDLVSDVTIPVSSIPENAFYIRASRRSIQAGAITGTHIDETQIFINKSDLWKNYFFNGYGHINKVTGDIDPSSGTSYINSKFLKITDPSKIIVDGRSGGSATTIALAAFYDIDFKFLGSYNTADNVQVSSHLIPTASVPSGAYYIRTTSNAGSTNSIISGVSANYPTEVNDVIKTISKIDKGDVRTNLSPGYVSKLNGSFVNDISNVYLHSAIYTILDKNNLVLKTGFSGSSTSNISLISFYDIDFVFIGYYNIPDVSGIVTDVLIPSSSIPTNAIYCATTLSVGRRDDFSITGASVFTPKNTLSISKIANFESSRRFNLQPNEVFGEVGYIDKRDGKLNTSSASYRGSLPFIISDRNNIVVTGFSGVTNNASLAYFYDKFGTPLKSYNAPTHGNVSSHLIPASEVPSDAYYVKFTRATSQTSYPYSGVSTVYNTREIIRMIDNKLSDAISDVKVERSGRPNPDFGGHVKLINYLGNDQNIHPKVLYFQDGWNGYKYWMAYTPYPGGATLHENPCIAASNDGKLWETPSGLVNPLEFAPRDETRPLAYNSDTHLVYNNDTNKLECWWRSYDPTPAEVSIKRRVSSNGITWEPIEVLSDWHVTREVSQSVIYESGVYKYWACVQGKVAYRESSDPYNFPPFEDLPIDLTGLNAWHMDVIKTSKGYEYAIQCWQVPGGTNNSSDLYYVLYDGVTYTKPKLIVERGDQPTDRDFLGIYRASILYIPTGTAGGVYSIYYSAIADGFSFRAIYLTKGRSVDRLRGVNL